MWKEVLDRHKYRLNKEMKYLFIHTTMDIFIEQASLSRTLGAIVT